jgi:hypothetical protein
MVNKVKESNIDDNSVTTTKVSDSAITTAKINADAITEAKIADNAISEEHLDTTVFTGNTELSATAADDDVLLVYDTSAGVIKKIQKSNVALSAPTFSSVSPTSLTTGDLTGNYTIVVTGTKFDATATFKLRTTGGTDISMDSVSRDSSTQLTGTVAKNTANLTNANEPFDIIITNGNSLSTTSEDQINIDAQPVYTTTAGSLGTVDGDSAISTIDIVAADPESAGNVTFDVQSGTIPPGLSTATVNENGVSKFRITGTPDNPGATTTFNFTLRASDAASNTSSRAFSITVTRIPTSQSFTSSGTFSVPSGMSSLNAVLIVAGGGTGGDAFPGPNLRMGGGGGAGGLIYFPEYPVTPGGTITVTVGEGGNSDPNGACAVDNGDSSAFGSPGDPGLSPTGEVLTANGGGYGGRIPGGAPSAVASPGGSGGGGAVQTCVSSGGIGSATQPTAPGNSGAYGFGNIGGASSGAAGGGGGGAGQGGGTGSGVFACVGGTGGIGKAYSIADGTTPVYYAGGGGGGSYNGFPAPYVAAGGNGGQGGGGPSGDNPTQSRGEAGQANKGGGGGGSYERGGGNGGKGIVIVRY